jgi:hypothetical protein
VVSSRKFFFGGGWHFWLVKKSFLSFTHTENSSTTNESKAPDKLFILCTREEKEGRKEVHTKTPLSLFRGKKLLF